VIGTGPSTSPTTVASPAAGRVTRPCLAYPITAQSSPSRTGGRSRQASDVQKIPRQGERRAVRPQQAPDRRRQPGTDQRIAEEGRVGRRIHLLRRGKNVDGYLKTVAVDRPLVAYELQQQQVAAQLAGAQLTHDGGAAQPGRQRGEVARGKLVVVHHEAWFATCFRRSATTCCRMWRISFSMSAQ